MAQTASQVLVETCEVDDLRRHGQGLMRAHAREMEPELADLFEPNWTAYYILEEKGELITIAAWIQKLDLMLEEPVWELVGYAVAFLLSSMHYDMVDCHHDLLYVDPRHRKGRVGLRLIQAVEQQAKMIGADRVLMHAKVDTVLQDLLPRLGFQEEEHVFVKELE